MDNAKINIKVCIGSACHLKGSYEVISEFQGILENEAISPEDVDLSAVFCMGECTKAVSVQINDQPVVGLSPAEVKDFFAKKVKPLLIS